MTLTEVLALAPADGSQDGGGGFIGRAPQDGWKRIFGGLVAGQALMAAYAETPGRLCHSLHGYFLIGGDPALPIRYAVERVRDGFSFCVRRVDAHQNGRVIFTLMASFQTPEDGLSHQQAMPEAPAPESLMDEMQRWLSLGDALPERARAIVTQPLRVEVRRAGAPDGALYDRSPNKMLWMRARDPLPADPAIQQAALLYGSDMTFLSTAIAVHGLDFWSPGLQTASLDHSLWLHRPTDFNDWHLYVQETPSASGGRGFVQGRMFRRDGALVASMAQEGLMRQRRA